MEHIIGKDRFQSYSFTLEERIAADNPVRVIDAFVEVLPLEKMGFTKVKPQPTGRPSYQPGHLLKLYLYGYYNRIRSSRRLEAECVRNIELHWLIQGLTPAYHTIADFRKQHPEALRAVFKSFVSFLKGVDLLDGDYIAIDDTKFRAVNSKKNNYTQAKIDRHLAYIDAKTSEYLQALEQQDEEDNKANISKKK